MLDQCLSTVYRQCADSDGQTQEVHVRHFIAEDTAEGAAWQRAHPPGTLPSTY